MSLRLSIVIVALSLVTGCRRMTTCSHLDGQIRSAVESAPGACAVDADCACYNGGAAANTCGGVAAKALASQIDRLTSEYRAERCGQVDCAAWVCTPRCEAGRCANAAPAP